MTEHKTLSEEDELDTIGGFEKRPIMDIVTDAASKRVVMRGMALVDAENTEGDTFESVRFVVMMPKNFEDEELYASEFAMSFTGEKTLIPAALKHFADAKLFEETGEVWLDAKWLNAECDIKIISVSRETDAEMGYSPMRQMKASREPRKTDRTDLPSECAPAAAYQQPNAEIDGSSGGEYQM